MTLKTFVTLPTHMMNICDKFHWNPYTKCRDIASRDIYVNGRRTDGRTTRKYNASCRLLLAAEAYKR